MKAAVLVLVGLLALSVASTDRTTIARRHENEVPRTWKIVEKAPLHEQISFTIYLKQANLDVLYQKFKAVSDPKSPEWGKFLTREQLDDMQRPSSQVFEDFEAWLSGFDVQYQMNAATIKVKTTVGVASKMFQVRFDQYRHLNGKTVTRLTGEATLPTHLAQHTKFVAGLSELFSERINGQHYLPRGRTTKKDESATNLVITPSVLKSYYGIPSNAKATNPSNYQGIAAFDDYFSLGALQQFDSTEGIPTPNVTREGPDCFPKCDQYESDLDIQYVTAMGEGVNTLFLVQGVDYWILQWAEEALALEPYPLVWSISYGYSELDQCEIATVNCNALGYNSEEYIAATNIYLQQFATLGVSVLVSDGDDGACNLGGATGNCPIDDNNYCPLGGCAHTTTQCGMFTVKEVSTGELCFYPMGLGSDACATVLSNTLYANLAINAFLSANKACGVAIEQDSEKDPHFYSSCTCSQLKSTTNYGLQVSGYQYVQSNGALFTADYPTSSPYVTSVGATQFLTNSNGAVTEEVVCSILTGAIITTGGGFSLYQAAEDYQTQAVRAWSSNTSNPFPPSYSYNINNRAYPDVAFNGHNYLIYYSENTSDNCPCASGEVDGTSCSSPALAGMISLINDQLLNAGKPQLGFLNYLLYQMAAEQPSAFNDIISGNNNCNRAWCCQYGYTAVPGWDPASGLGSPNYEAFLNYVLNAKGLY